MQRFAAVLDDVLAVVLLQQPLDRRGVVVDDYLAVEHPFDNAVSGPDTVADVLADGDTGAGDDTGEPQQEDYQYGLASGLAKR